MSYVHEVFEVFDLDKAKNVVLTDDPTDPRKFNRETALLIDTIKRQNIITDKSLVLDYGCGMGRVSRELIKTFGCEVLGLDPSPSMTFLAREYVGSSRFHTLSQYTTPDSVDVVLCSFVLQHVEFPQKEIDNIKRVLKPGGTFILLNERTRFVPSDVDRDGYVVWKNDGFDVHAEVSNILNIVDVQPYTDDSHKIVFFHKQ